MSVRDDLKAFVDGELPPRRMAEVQEALDRDAALAREVAELRALASAVRQSAPQFTVGGLDETLGALQRNERRRRIWLRLPFGLAAAAAAVLVIMVWPQRQEDVSDAVAYAPASKQAKSGEADEASPASPPLPKPPSPRTSDRTPRSDGEASSTASPPTRMSSGAGGEAPRSTRWLSHGAPNRSAGKAIAATTLTAPEPAKSSAPAPATKATPADASAPAPTALLPNAVARASPRPSDDTTITLVVDSPEDAEARLRAASASLEATVANDDSGKPVDPAVHRVVLDVPAGKLVQARNLILGLTARPSSITIRAADPAFQYLKKPDSPPAGAAAADQVKADRPAAPVAGSFAAAGGRAPAALGRSVGAGGGGGFGGGAFGRATSAAPQDAAKQKAPKAEIPAGQAFNVAASKSARTLKPAPVLARRRIIVIFRRKDTPPGKIGP